jgi:hypothetical protein
VSARGRSYRYVGPVGLKAAVQPGSGGCRISSAADFRSWVAERSAVELAESFSFVVGMDGVRWRRDEASMWLVLAEQWF